MQNSNLEYCFVSMKTVARCKTHPGSDSFSQVNYIFTKVKTISIAVFIIKFMLRGKFKCSHY